MATKITMEIVFSNGTAITRIYHAAGAIDQTGKPGYKVFTGKKDGEANDGAMEIDVSSSQYTVLSQKHEAE